MSLRAAQGLAPPSGSCMPAIAATSPVTSAATAASASDGWVQSPFRVALAYPWSNLARACARHSLAAASPRRAPLA